MFFNAELLSKRDSGFGLLWLAATLGSKSSFKKLPKQSIRSADIPQLCEQIAHPNEPLALRLSSNLMVGVARVFKIKHEIFYTDVNNCFALVRKAIQEIHNLGAITEAQLTMGHSTVRPDTVTLDTDPTIAVALELDTFNASWDDILGFTSQRRGNADENNDEDFTPQMNKAKGKGKAKPSMNTIEAVRGAHTLDESLEHLLLSTSFDGNLSFGGFDPSSSQFDVGAFNGSFAFDDNLLDGADGLDGGFDPGIGEDLARELGDGWGAQTAPGGEEAAMQFDLDPQMNFEFGEEAAMDVDAPFLEVNGNNETGANDRFPSKSPLPGGRKRPHPESDKENRPPGSTLTPSSALSNRSQTPLPYAAFDAFHIADNPNDLPEQQGAPPHDPNAMPAPRKPKRVRILMDDIIELTDEELRAARDKYLERQQALRLEIDRKRAVKDAAMAFEQMIWAAPEGLVLPELTEFWTSRYKIQVEARSGAVHLDDRGEPSPKRQKTSRGAHPGAEADEPMRGVVDDAGFGTGFDAGFDQGEIFNGDMDFGGMQDDFNAPLDMEDPGRHRSSEEPERGRNASRPPSLLGFDAEALNPSSGTQRSAFYPWDNAAGTSSTNGGAYLPLNSGSDRVSIGKADIQIRLPRSSLSGTGSRRESSILPSQAGSLSGLNFGISADGLGHRGSDDFQFDVTNDLPTAQDTQDTEMTLVTLEKTSYNFLEYCKMQLRALPGQHASLSFDDVVPSASSTKRVAAAALYHCLVLATKDLVSIKQEQPFDPITLKIK